MLKALLNPLTNIIAPVWTRIAAIGVSIAFVLATLAAAYWRIRKDAIREVEAEQTRARLDAVRRRKALEDDVQVSPDADLDRRADRWGVRDTPKNNR